MSERKRTGPTDAGHPSWRCDDCGWPWPLPGEPPAGSECDNCGGELVITTPRALPEAETTRETCTVCSMVANVDPSLHAERYGHTPEVRRDGKVYRFDWQTYTFGIEVR
jgi:hypothetical protein